MDKDSVVAALAPLGLKVVKELRQDYGWRLDIGNGAIVNVYDSGKYVVQGKAKDQGPVNEALSNFQGASGGASPAQSNHRKIFVVYGHDGTARTGLEAMLRRWNLEPLILDQLPSSGQTIIEKLESVRQEANFAVVLATPDDEGHRAGHDDEKALRARQNVVLELGMMLAVLGRPRVAILVKSEVKMERPSDIQGLIYIPYKDNVAEAALALAKEINAQGIPIDLNKL